jgi:hypothetical protein
MQPVRYLEASVEDVFETAEKLVLASTAKPGDTQDHTITETLATFIAGITDFWVRVGRVDVPATVREQLRKISNGISGLTLPELDFEFTEFLQPAKINAFAAQYKLDRNDVIVAVLTTIRGFLLFQGQGSTPEFTRLMFLELLEFTLQRLAEPPAPEPAPKAPAKTELYNDRLLARVFKPNKQTIASLEAVSASYVLYQPELQPGVFGQDIRGLAFTARKDLPFAHQPFAGNLFILLETGEHIVVPEKTINLAGVHDPEAHERIAPSLLLQAIVAAPLLVLMGVITRSQADTIIETFGTVKPDAVNLIGDSCAVGPIEQVFVRGKDAQSMLAQITGPSGAEVRFPVDATKSPVYHAISLVARITPSGYYLVSNLVESSDDKDVVLMRNDYPRQLSPYGVYLFPTEDRLFSLSVFPHNFILSHAG